MWKVIVLLGFCLLYACATNGQPLNFKEVDVNDEDVVSATNFASRFLSESLPGKYHLRLLKILKAQKQVNDGNVTYFIELFVGQTKCEKKKRIDYENIEDCEFQDYIKPNKCSVNVFRKQDGNFEMRHMACLIR